jgi:WD40 repeat protein
MTIKNTRPNPYVGPRAFRTGEALYGRASELNELMNLLIAERIVLLHSPSGAGKSSLIQAGLLPRLVEEGFQVLPVARVNQELPAELRGKDGFNRYIYSTLTSLDEALPEEQRLPLDELAALSLPDYLERFKVQYIAAVHTPEDLPPMDAEVLIFDQFEEVLTIDPTGLEAKQAFFAQLGLALRDRKRWALFSMREDYLAALDPYLRPVPTRFNNTFRLDLLGVDAALQAIQLPAIGTGVKFLDQAARKLVDDLRQVLVQRPDGEMEPQPGPYVEPVQLQVVCYRLWQNLAPDDREITIEDVASVGDVNQSLGEYYDERAASVAEETGVSERLVREWFGERLITPSGIRSQVLMEPGQSGGLDNSAIRLLEDAHLVRSEKRRGATWFELAHDRLLEPVQASNAAWFQAHLSLLQRQAALWHKENRPDHLLLREAALSEAEQWVAGHPNAVSPIDQDFLDACLQQRAHEEEARAAAERERLLKLEAAEKVAEAERLRAEEQARAAKKLRTRLILATLAFIAALFFAGAAVFTGNQARLTAEQNRILAITAQSASTLAVGNAATAQANAAAAEAASNVAYQQKSTAVAAEATARAAGDIALAQKATAVYNAGVAERQASLASSRELSSLSLDYLESQPDLALLLSIEGYRKAQTGQALDSLLTAMQRNLNRELQQSNQQIPEQPIGIYAMAASPDGHHLAWAGVQGMIRMWDFKLQKVIWENTTGIRINVLDFSPDGKILASADDAGKIVFWDTLTGNRVRLIYPEIISIYAMAFSPDGASLAYGGVSKGNDINLFVRVLDTGFIKGFNIRPLKTDVLSLAWSPDGRLLATGSRERILRIWDVATERQLRTFDIYDGPIKSLAFSPNGQWLATGANDEVAPIDKNILMWDISLCDRPAQTQSREQVQAAAVDSWDDPACRLQIPISFTGQEADISSIAFSPDGLILASGDTTGRTRLWDVLYREPLEQQPPRASGIVSVVTFSQVEDNLLLAVSSLDRTISLSNLRTTDSLMAFDNPVKSDVYSVVFTSATSFRAIGSDGTQTVLLGGDASGSVSQAATFTPQSSVYTLSKDGKSFAVLVSNQQDAHIEVWSVGGNSSLLSIPAPVGTVVSTKERSDSTTITQTLTTSLGTVSSLAFSPDGATLAAGVCLDREEALNLCTQSEIHLWQVASGDPLAQLPTQHSNAILSLAYSADGRLLASGGGDAAIYLHDIATGQPLGLPLIGQGGPVTSLAFSPDGSQLASGSSKSLLALWNVDSAQLIGDPIAGMKSAITALAFSPDGKTLVSGTDEGELAWWRQSDWLDLACKYSLRNLSQAEWTQFFKGEPYRQTCPQYPPGQ